MTNNSLKKKISIILHQYISSFSQRDKRYMIFGAWWGNKFDDNSKYLYEYIIKERPDLNAYWITPNKEVYNLVSQMGYPVLLSDSKEAKMISLKAKYLITVTSIKDIGDCLEPYIGGITHINLWHGVPLKKILFDDIYNRPVVKWYTRLYNRMKLFPLKNRFIICTSEFYHEIYQSAFQQKANSILNLGQARNDYFFCEHINPFRVGYGVKKIVLYMPTHRQEGKVEMDMHIILDLESINRICMANNAVFLIKKHFYHSKDKMINDNEYSCIKEITNLQPDPQILLDASDVLITDYSSCFVDHLLLDRPQIFYTYDYDDYLKNDREMYFNFLESAPGCICSDMSELNNELENVLLGKDKYIEVRHKEVEKYYSPHNRGVVSGNQLEAILNL